MNNQVSMLVEPNNYNGRRFSSCLGKTMFRAYIRRVV